MAGNGYEGGIIATIPVSMTIATFFGIAVYNVIEINLLIFFTFKRCTGLYFWSLLIASWGIIFHVLGFLLKFFSLCTNEFVNITIITIGGTSMVIGQSVVLYSRLHLVVQDGRKIRWILVMIILGFFVFTVPPTILNYGSNSQNPTPFLQPFAIYEKIMLFGFSTEECIISGLYIWETWKTLQVLKATRGKDVDRVWKHLIYVNILAILMDFTVIGIEFGNQYDIETAYKSAVYSVKLKLEFAVLNQLRTLVQREKLSSCRSRDMSHQYSPRKVEHAIGDSLSFSTALPSTEGLNQCFVITGAPMAQKREGPTGEKNAGGWKADGDEIGRMSNC